MNKKHERWSSSLSKWGSQDHIGRTQSEFKEKHSQHSHNNWKAGTPEEILDKYDPESEKELEKIPKKKLAPKPRKKPRKNIGNLSTVLEEDSEGEMNEDKEMEKEKPALSKPLGHRKSK